MSVFSAPMCLLITRREPAGRGLSNGVPLFHMQFNTTPWPLMWGPSVTPTSPMIEQDKQKPVAVVHIFSRAQQYNLE